MTVFELGRMRKQDLLTILFARWPQTEVLDTGRLSKETIICKILHYQQYR